MILNLAFDKPAYFCVHSLESFDWRFLICTYHKSYTFDCQQLNLKLVLKLILVLILIVT